MIFMPLAAIDFGFRGILQIAILTWLIFYVFNLFRGTRSAQMLFGIIIILGGLTFVTTLFDLDVLRFLLGKLPIILATALVIIFQPEIRQAFLTIGHRRFLLKDEGSKDKVIDIVCKTAESLSMRKFGALIVLERDSHLLEFTKTGTMLNAPIGPDLLSSIFYPNTPLHDGAVIIKGETILAARCILPLSSVDLGRGTRHRAGLGLSEKVDAVVVIVSEETGSISIACGGRFITNLTKVTLGKYLARLLRKEGLSEAIKRSLNELEIEGPETAGASRMAEEEVK